MKSVRLVVHPVLANKRSRFILFSYMAVAAVSNAFLWWFALRSLRQSDILIYYQTFNPSWYVSLLTSPILHVAVALGAVLVGASLTSIYVIGPVKRLEQWLKDWEAGHQLRPFKVRGSKDYLYDNVVSLINQLYEKR